MRLLQGMLNITMSAILPKLHPQPCPTQVNCQEASSQQQLWVLYLSLLLTSMGNGGTQPCVVTFPANQFDMTKSGVLQDAIGTTSTVNLLLLLYGSCHTNCIYF
ncbi:protein NRT1/ PTR FAMILY 3.1-like isoform X2 [Spinacia oleracea]|uniref:Protein NRT1/ PTR FAMILY 3.1-like isoform X2 n=1 Tax=Spinacia oleracea TaxID=3562 RepID=A0ABM3QGD1_SPIOL|nr:protein NRT1/ PTR FAMILY 3.1-like isoform X2 [Spinacia oleracea]XP_056682412.1 protein NRT1/ PTR FAMILY 3.1-like isoform X2 [Spinacia oleracea]